jgi:hypothetical protein
MKKHPAIKAATKLLKNAGLDVIQVMALEFKVLSREYNDMPLYVYIRPSAHSDNLARFEICNIYQMHTEYEKAAKLHLQEFTF